MDEDLVILPYELYKVNITEEVGIQDFCGPGNPYNSVDSRWAVKPAERRPRDEVDPIRLHSAYILPERVSPDRSIELRLPCQYDLRVPGDDLLHRDLSHPHAGRERTVCYVPPAAEVDELRVLRAHGIGRESLWTLSVVDSHPFIIGDLSDPLRHRGEHTLIEGDHRPGLLLLAEEFTHEPDGRGIAGGVGGILNGDDRNGSQLILPLGDSGTRHPAIGGVALDDDIGVHRYEVLVVAGLFPEPAPDDRERHVFLGDIPIFGRETPAREPVGRDHVDEVRRRWRGAEDGPDLRWDGDGPAHHIGDGAGFSL